VKNDLQRYLVRKVIREAKPLRGCRKSVLLHRDDLVLAVDQFFVLGFEVRRPLTQGTTRRLDEQLRRRQLGLSGTGFVPPLPVEGDLVHQPVGDQKPGSATHGLEAGGTEEFARKARFSNEPRVQRDHGYDSVTGARAGRQSACG
jgi:hypothetical protein